MFIVVIVALCGFSLQASAEVTVRDAWARLLPPTVKTTAAYMTIKATENDVLVSASSPVVDRVEIHESKMVDGMMSMTEVGRIVVSADTETELKPGGFHLMLIGLQSPLQESGHVSLVLNFEKAGEVKVKALVRQP